MWKVMDFKFRELFQEAFRLWYSKSPGSKLSSRTPVFKFFRKFQILLKNVPSSLGFRNYVVRASVGVGKWATIPWIGLRNGLNTSNFQSGLFVVYVLSPDYKRFYLTLIQGVQDRTIFHLENSARNIRKKIIKPEGFTEGIDGALASHSSINSLSYKYEKAIVYSKKYDLNNLPDESILRNDLKNALTAHQTSI